MANVPDDFGFPGQGSPIFVKTFNAEHVGLYVRQQFIDTPGVSETAKLNFYKCGIDNMIATLQSWIVGGKVPTDLQKKIMRWPDGAWQMFKEQHMPHWFKKKFPVRWHEEVFVVQTNHYFVCPHLVTDSRDMHVKFMATGTRLAGEMHPGRY